MALNGLCCADVQLRNYSLTQSLAPGVDTRVSEMSPCVSWALGNECPCASGYCRCFALVRATTQHHSSFVTQCSSRLITLASSVTRPVLAAEQVSPHSV